MIREVIIPAAGLGTRMTSITKGKTSKLMLPLNKKPIISYAIDEAIQSFCDKIHIVLNERHQDLYNFLKQKYHNVNLILQKEPLGIAESISQAEPFILHKFFAVILPDILITSKVPVILQMKQAFQDIQANMLGLLQVAPEEKNFFGACEFSKRHLKEINQSLFKIKKIFSKKDSNRDLYHVRSILSRSFFGF